MPVAFLYCNLNTTVSSLVFKGFTISAERWKGLKISAFYYITRPFFVLTLDDFLDQGSQTQIR
jgi:hypothetical protein